MAMEEDAREWFCEVVGNVDRHVDIFQMDKISFYPVTKGKVFNFDVVVPCCRFLCIHYGLSR